MRSKLQCYLNALASELNPIRFLAAADRFTVEGPRAARPLLHSRVRLNRKASSRVIPTETNPDRLRIGAIAIAEALTVVVIKREDAVRTGEHAQRRWVGHRLGGVLAHRIEGE